MWACWPQGVHTLNPPSESQGHSASRNSCATGCVRVPCAPHARLGPVGDDFLIFANWVEAPHCGLNGRCSDTS